jgi:hypothetical protein
VVGLVWEHRSTGIGMVFSRRLFAAIGNYHVVNLTDGGTLYLGW